MKDYVIHLRMDVAFKTKPSSMNEVVTEFLEQLSYTGYPLSLEYDIHAAQPHELPEDAEIPCICNEEVC